MPFGLIESNKTDTQYTEDRYARTLAEADIIKADPKKMKMAKAGAKRMIKEDQEELKGLKKIG